MSNIKDQANREFWEELCGTSLAKFLGIRDHTQESLRRFDQAYMNFYPYLLSYVRPDLMAGQRVLEIGLGYGTLGQIMAARSRWYLGLDIASGPVKMINHRIHLVGLNGLAVQGSALQMPFNNESFDQVVSIGCFHHSGDANRCVQETYRVLKPGGRAVVMVYNKFSYRLWLRWPVRSLTAFLLERRVSSGQGSIDERLRGAYDRDSEGRAAPETAYFSIKEVRDMFKKYKEVQVRKENCLVLTLLGQSIIPRDKLLTLLGRSMGLDLYVQAFK
jgi:ubiquinone/menaquinone biosynthesis C-methylase UbiE